MRRPGHAFHDRARPLYEICADYLGSLVVREPERLEVRIARGDAFREAQLYDNALADYTYVLQRLPKNRNVLDRRSKTYYQKASDVGNYAEQIVLMQRGKQDDDAVQRLKLNEQ